MPVDDLATTVGPASAAFALAWRSAVAGFGGGVQLLAVFTGLFGLRTAVAVLRGVSMVLHRIGFSPQVPKHRPVERDEAAIATWRREAWPQAK